MKRSYRNVMAALLVLGVLAGTVPTALAERVSEEATISAQGAAEAAVEPQQGVSEAPTKIEPVSVTVSAAIYPEGQKPGDITVTTANIFLLGDSGATVCFAISGLPEEGDWFAVDAGNVTWCSPQSTGLKSISFYNVREEGEKTFTFTLRNSYQEDEATIVYAPVTLKTTIAPQSALPLTQEELYEGPVLLSNSAAQIGISVYAPLGGETEGLRGVLTAAGNSTDVYAVSLDRSPVQVSKTPRPDVRYRGIFTWDPPFRITCARIYVNGYCGKPLVTGKYDLLIYKGEVPVYTLPAAVEVTDKPLVSVQSDYDRANAVGGKTAYGQVTLAGGDIHDVELGLYYDSRKIGTSSTPRITQVYDGEVRATYALTLSEALSQSNQYELRAVSKTGVAYAGETTNQLQLSGANQIKLIQGAFSGGIYANAVLLTQGGDPTASYKLQLKPDHNGAVLSEVITPPNSEGVFDIEFLGVDDQPIQLEADKNYVVNLFSWNDYNGEWSTNYNISANMSTYDMSPEESGEPQAANYSGVDTENGKIFATIIMDKNKDDLSKLDAARFTLHITSVTGETEVTLQAAYQREVYGINAQHTIIADISQEMPLGHYWVELFHDGKSLVNTETGENWLKKDYATQYSNEPYLSVSGMNHGGLYFATTLYAKNMGQARKAELQLYAFGNKTAKPDKTVTWDPVGENSDIDLTDANAAGLDLTQRYSSVVLCDGVPTGAEDNARRWMTAETYSKLDDGIVPPQPVTVTQTPHGRLEAMPHAGSTLAAVAPWTEVYLKSVPDEGYRLKPNSVTVNGKANFGRTFLVTDKPCTVTAKFELIPVKKYSISLETYINGGTLTMQPEAAEGETVVVTPKPDENYAVQTIQYRIGTDYIWKDISANPAGIYSFKMPRGNVVLKAEFHYLNHYNVTTEYDYNMGQIQADSYILEGSTVNVTVKPGSNHHLGSLIIKDTSDNAVTATETLTGYSFVMPAADVTVTAVFTEGPGVSIGEGADGTLIVKISGQGHSGLAVVALYDAQGKMVGVVTPADDGYFHAVELQRSNYPSAETVKAFLLDSNGGLKPRLPATIHLLN